MTRENKLALVVGFGLLLLVGILVSDHFSPARIEAPGDLRAGSEPRLAGQTTEWEPVAAGTPATAGPTSTTELRRPGGPGGPDRAAGGPRPGNRPSDDGPARNEPADTTGGTGGAGTARPADPAPPEGQLVSGTAYVVVRGDTLEGIAQREYGDRRLAGRLATVNRISDPATIRIGQEILLPPVAILQQGVGARLVSSDETSGRMPQRPVAPRTYVVKPNDTLSGIAQAQLGTATAWRRIFDLNRDMLRTERDLHEGQVLRLPASP